MYIMKAKQQNLLQHLEKKGFLNILVFKVEYTYIDYENTSTC